LAGASANTLPLGVRALGLWPENAFLNPGRILVSDAKTDGSLARC